MKTIVVTQASDRSETPPVAAPASSVASGA